MARNASEYLLAKITLAERIIEAIQESGLLKKKPGRKPGKKAHAAGVKADGTPKAKPGPKPKKAPQKAATGNGGTTHAPAVGEE
jgi:hypothetical protein